MAVLIRAIAAAGLVVIAVGDLRLGYGWLAGCYLTGVALWSWTWPRFTDVLNAEKAPASPVRARRGLASVALRPAGLPDRAGGG